MSASSSSADLRNRIIFTIAILAVYRFGTFVPLPGIDPEQLKTMMEKSQRQSVPQIFIGDYHVGGFDDLIEHDMDGKLEKLLED